MDESKINSGFNPLVSIVIPVYNGANYLAEAIESALAQTYINIEVLVVNDGSKDNGATEAIALTFGDKVRYFHKENGGVATALNRGISEMQGDYFSWLSHDDLYYPTKVETQIDFLKKSYNKEVILYSDFDFVDEIGSFLRTYKVPHHEPEMFRPAFVFGGLTHGCTLLVPKVSFDKCGVFDPSLRTTQDYDMWFRLSEKYNFIHLPQVLIKSREHPLQDTRSKKDIVLKENNSLYIYFLKKLSIEEIDKYSNNQAAFYYVDFSLQMKRAGFDDAAKYAIALFMRLIVQLPYREMKKALFYLLKKIYPERLEQYSKVKRRLRYDYTILKYKSPFYDSKLRQIPIIINNRNRYTYMRMLIEWLEKAGMTNIYIIDNNSTYPPLLEYYKTTPYQVYRLKENVGYLALWETNIFDKFKDDFYIYTDSDVVPINDCPKNYINYFRAILELYPKVDKIGFGLKIDDIPECFSLKAEVIELESKWWQNRINDKLFNSRIDTTFALYRPGRQGGHWLQALRTGFPYIARHMPWYTDTDDLSEEEKYYKKNATSHSYWYTKIKEVNK